MAIIRLLRTTAVAKYLLRLCSIALMDVDFFDDYDDEERLRIVCLALIVLGAEEARQNRQARRNRTRHYLCRPELLPNPRVDTPWQKLYESRSDRAYITTMGVDVATFHYLLDEGFTELWDSTPIERDDTDAGGRPRPGARSLDAAGGLGLYLHWLCSTMRETSLQLIFALVPMTVNRYIAFAQKLLLEVLRGIPEGAVAWPAEPEEYERLSQLVQVRDYLYVHT